jgi:hypothetical protein
LIVLVQLYCAISPRIGRCQHWEKLIVVQFPTRSWAGIGTLGEFNQVWYPIVMTRHQAGKIATYQFRDLTIWRTKLPNTKHAVLPPHNNRSNPLVDGALVYVSVFSEGAVCALDRKSGKLLWRKEIARLGGSAVHLGQGRLFAKTAHTLYALEPATGKTIWSFCPYGDSGESIYSDPTIYRSSLYIGDRRGFLHCLDSRTGQTRWKVRTSSAKNCDVNSTPVVVKGLVIVGTNASMAAAYDVKTGRRAWVRRLDGPSVFGPLLSRDSLVAITHSIYFLKPESGRVIRRFSWKRDGVSEADCTRRDVVCMLRGSWPPSGESRLVGLNETEIQFTENSAAYVALIHFASETNLIYVSHLQGIDVRRPASGTLVCKIERKSGSSGIGLVDVKGNTIYALVGDGYVYALRHPTV